MADVITTMRGGLPLATGALRRPYDPASDRYRLTRTLPPRAVDLSQPRYLAGDGWDWREPVDKDGQGQMGSCAAFATASAASTARRVAQTQAGDEAAAGPVTFHQSWLYHHARARRGWAGQDSGSFPEDNLDLLRAGAPARGTAYPFAYVADPQWTPPAELEAAERHDYVLSYRPFYPANNDGLDAAQAIALALDEGMPVCVAMEWPSAFFSPGGPGGCVLPSGLSPAGGSGGHEVWIWGLTDAGQGLALARNSWSPGWTPDAAQFGHHMQPGDFAIPWEYLTGPRAMAWVFHAVSFEPVAPAPKPEPQPQPEPAKGTYRAVTQLWQPGAEGWQIDAVAAGEFRPRGGRAWLASAVVAPDGAVVYPSVFQPVEVPA